MTNDTKTIIASGIGCLAIMAFIGVAVAIPCVIVIGLVKWIL